MLPSDPKSLRESRHVAGGGRLPVASQSSEANEPNRAASIRTAFPITRWSLVRRATLGGEALGSWVGTYWFPLYAWARQKGWAADDAADYVQDFLMRLCSRKELATADPLRGKLRSWLLKSFSNYLADTRRRHRRGKRGGDVPHVPLHLQEADAVFLDANRQGAGPDAVFARIWALSVLEEALDRLASHYADTGRSELFEVLLPALEAPFEGASSDEVGARLGMSGTAVRQAVHRMRQRYRRILIELAAKRLDIQCEERLLAELRVLLSE